MMHCEIYKDKFEFSTASARAALFPHFPLGSNRTPNLILERAARPESKALFHTGFKIILFQASAEILRKECCTRWETVSSLVSNSVQNCVALPKKNGIVMNAYHHRHARHSRIQLSRSPEKSWN